MATTRVPRPDDQQLRRLREAKLRFRDEILRIPGVHGIGIGYRQRRGRNTTELALVVHVERKRPKRELVPSELLPERLTFQSRDEKAEISVPVDVREAPRPVPEVACDPCDVNFGSRVRPVPGGFSVGLATQPGGTLGGWVWDDVNDQIVLISNHHVLGGVVNAQVIQPSIGDGGSSPVDNFGRVVRAGTLDVSLARATNGSDVETEIRCVTDGVYEIADPHLGMEVEKAGQTTGLTCGLVDLIDYDSGHYGSHNDVWIDGDGADFSNAGDSGALYVERVHPDGRSFKRVIGIHWGGSGNDGVGHPIRAVLEDVNATTICAGLFKALIESIFQRQEAEAESAEASARLARPRRDVVRVGLARDLERRLRSTKAGAEVVDLVHDQRASIVRVLMDGDGRRAALAMLEPVLSQAVTTDDVLDHRVDDADLKNAGRLLTVARRIQPEAADLVAFAEPLLGAALGRTIGELIGMAEAAGKPRPE